MILEAFTHAKTPLNPNSSRCQKYYELHFNKNGKLVGAKLNEMFLETRRVVDLPKMHKGNFNFNIFYEMFLPGVFTKEERLKYKLLDKISMYRYLCSSSASLPKPKKQNETPQILTPAVMRYLKTFAITQKSQGKVW